MFELIFLMMSEVDSSDLEYVLELQQWTETGVDLFINFTDPLKVSQGLILDIIVCKMKNKDLF